MRNAIVAVIAVASVALVAVGAASAGGNAYGVGGGWTGFAPGEHVAHFAFSAHERPNGDFGQVHWNLEDPQLQLDVTVNVDCVNVFPSLFGGTAWMDGPVTSVSPQPNFAGVMVGDRLAFQAMDGGEPSAAGMVDEFDAFLESDVTIGGIDCKKRPPLFLTPNVTQGNVVVNTG
jgi:hypothetical protein